MKKLYLLSLALAPFLYANAEMNSSLENNETLEITKISTEELARRNDLNHLFDNSKFPVDDYIYKAGLKKPTKEEVIEAIEELKPKKQEVKAEPKKEIKTEPKKEVVTPAPKPKLDTTELQNRLERNKAKFEEVAVVEQRNDYKSMLRDEILANRTSGISDFSSDRKFGVDGFSNQKSVDIATNEHKLSRMIRAGRLIPALLTSAISSDLSGIITAQIEQDIFAAHGRAVLIPRGSKAIGFYQNNNQIGQERLEIKWREIITPQGINILLTDAIVSDNIGMTGATGTLNNKYWDRYALPVGISTISNALLLSIASKANKNGNSNQTTNYQEQIYSSAQSDVNAVVQDILNQHKAIQPTIEIQSGSRIFLVPTNHMWFSKPKNNEVLMKYFIED